MSDAIKYEPSEWRELLIAAAAIELGLLKALLTEAAKAGALAERLGLDRRGASTLLDVLAELGYLESDASGRYRLTPKARALADESDPDYCANAILHSRNMMERWLALPEVVRSGEQRPRKQTPERRRVFIHSMDDLSRGAAPEIVGLCIKRLPEKGRVLDLGGGPGTYARLFAAEGHAVTILDQPDVVEMVAPELAGYGQIRMAAGDFNESLPEGPFDLVLLGNVTHIYGPEENRRLLERVAGVLKPGGAVAIIDMLRGRSRRATLFAVNMLISTPTGGTWTEAQYRGWLEGAGFTDIEVLDVTSRDAQLMLATLGA